MKNIFLLPITIAMSLQALSQTCPDNLLKFQGPICEKPINAGVKEVSCTELVVKWNGSKNQTFEAEATYIDPSSNKIIKTAETEIDCDLFGNCTASFKVVEGTKVNWYVQAKCKNGIYSDTLRGSEVVIPSCNPLSETIHVYPNPTAGNLTVEYLGINEGTVQFTGYDMAGKIVFSRIEQAQAGINTSYKFDLTGLTAGIYLLEARNGESVKWVKFIIE